jgi:hypothetical protein
VASCFLDITKGYAGVECGRDERVAQRVRSDPLDDAGPAREAAHDPSGCVPVKPSSVAAEQDRTFAAFTHREIYGPRRAWREGNGDGLAALRTIVSVRWPRSRPSFSMSAPHASETRSPFNASRDSRA